MARNKGPVKARNRHAIHPLMAKGGCHQKTTGALRAADKRALRAQLARPAVDAPRAA